MPILGYIEWRKFDGAIDKAKEACKASQQAVPDHFGGAAKMIKIASGTEKVAERKIDDFHLSRYACYLIAQNGDSRKEEIALAQTYFAFQTHRQEIHDQQLEDNKRVALLHQTGQLHFYIKNFKSKFTKRPFCIFVQIPYIKMNSINFLTFC
jgi:DNA-damage-inducible protein D